MTILADNGPPSVLVLGDGPLAVTISGRLRREGLPVVVIGSLDETAVAQAIEGAVTLGALVIVAPEPQIGIRLLDVTDSHLESSLAQFLDLFGALRLAIPHLIDGGTVLAITTRGYLGAWGGAHEMAFSGAVAGLLRSVALENMDRNVRANLIAVELPRAGVASGSDEIAELANYLLSAKAAAVNGELILANGGRSLKIREARDWRARRSPA